MTNLSFNLLGGTVIMLGAVAVCSAAWDTRRVTTLQYTFNNAHAFNSPVASWNTAKVSQFRFAFSNAYAFNQPIGGQSTLRTAAHPQTRGVSGIAAAHTHASLHAT